MEEIQRKQPNREISGIIVKDPMSIDGQPREDYHDDRREDPQDEDWTLDRWGDCHFG